MSLATQNPSLVKKQIKYKTILPEFINNKTIKLNVMKVPKNIVYLSEAVFRIAWEHAVPIELWVIKILYEKILIKAYLITQINKDY